jgi:hypothetical protein
MLFHEFGCQKLQTALDSWHFQAFDEGKIVDKGEVYARIAQMREAGAIIGRSAANINDCIEAVDREMWALGADRFMSVGAEAFRAEYNRMKPKLQEAFRQIQLFQEKLETSANDIETASRSTSIPE